MDDKIYLGLKHGVYNYTWTVDAEIINHSHTGEIHFSINGKKYSFLYLFPTPVKFMFPSMEKNSFLYLFPSRESVVSFNGIFFCVIHVKQKLVSPSMAPKKRSKFSNTQHYMGTNHLSKYLNTDATILGDCLKPNYWL